MNEWMTVWRDNSDSKKCLFQATSMKKKIQRDLNKQKIILITVLPPKCNSPAYISIQLCKLKLIIFLKPLCLSPVLCPLPFGSLQNAQFLSSVTPASSPPHLPYQPVLPLSPPASGLDMLSPSCDSDSSNWPLFVFLAVPWVPVKIFFKNVNLIMLQPFNTCTDFVFSVTPNLLI